MASARPAAGLDIAPKVDRAAAALNSIAETNQRVTALYEMSRTLSSILSLEDTLAILSNRLSKLIPFNTCAVSLFDPSRSEFEIIHAVGLHSERLLGRRLPAEAGITGWVITNQRPMYNTNPVLDLGFLGSDIADTYKAVIVSPLVKNQTAIGAIALYSTDLVAYGSEHIQLMESISQPACDAINNALTFERGLHAEAAAELARESALLTHFERMRARGERLDISFSVVVLKLNHLNALGDDTQLSETLLKLGRPMRKLLRESDIIGCYGDDSLIALLSESGSTEAEHVCSRIEREIIGTRIPPEYYVSLGCATSPNDGSSLEALIQAAHSASRDFSKKMVALGFLALDNPTTELPS